MVVQSLPVARRPLQERGLVPVKRVTPETGSSAWRLTAVWSTMEAATSQQSAPEQDPTLQPVTARWAFKDPGSSVTLSTPAEITMAAAVGMLAVSISVRVRGTAPASETTLAMASTAGEPQTLSCPDNQKTTSSAECYHYQVFVVFMVMDHSLSSPPQGKPTMTPLLRNGTSLVDFLTWFVTMSFPVRL